MADSDENKVDRKSHKRKSNFREYPIGGNRDPDDRNDRLLRAARRFVQDHGREKKEKDGTNLKKSRKHQRESKRKSRPCDSEKDVSSNEKSDRREEPTGRYRKRKKHRGDEKRSRQFRSDEKHKNNGKEHRQSEGGIRSEDNNNKDNDNSSIDDHDDKHDNELKQSGREGKSDRNRHRRKPSRDPKDKRKRKREKQYSAMHKHKTKHSTGTSTHKDKDISCYPQNQNTPLNKVPLYPIGRIVAHPPEKKIDNETDYFSFHSHLRLYLYRTSGTFFEDLKASETRSAFAEFCLKYNQGQLEEAYYSDVAKLPIEALQQCKRTRHAWNFKTSNTEQRSLDIIKAGVQKQTEYDVKVIPQGATSQHHRIEGRKATIPPRLDDLAKNQNKATRKNLTHGKESEIKIEMEQRAMLKMLGLDKIKSGQKITIAPREETR